MGTQSRNHDRAALLTGGTGLIGSRLARTLVSNGRRLALLCRPASVHRLNAWLERIPADAERPRVVRGDLDHPGLGLDAADLAWLKAEVAEIYHVGAAYDLSMSDQRAERTNVGGTQRIIDLARDLPSLVRLHHVSSMVVSGDYSGTYRETDFDVGQTFVHPYGQSKFDSERLVRGCGLPTTIYRPGAVVGDSQSGEMDKIDGPYYAFSALRNLRKIPGVTRMPMIVPRGDESFFHLVPVDYVVAALAHLAALPVSLDKTYHLTDPDPVSYRQFYLATLEAMGFTGPTIARPVERLVRLLMRPGLWPLVKRASRLTGVPAELMPHLLYQVRYDNTQALTDLAGSHIRCPSILEILPKLIEYHDQHMG